MADPRADQIDKLKLSIAALEEQQRASGLDLSASIAPLREMLAQMEEAQTPAPIVNRSGGIDARANTLSVQGDVVGRDKVDSHAISAGGQVIIAAEGATVVVGEAPVKMTAV